MEFTLTNCLSRNLFYTHTNRRWGLILEYKLLFLETSKKKLKILIEFLLFLNQKKNKETTWNVFQFTPHWLLHWLKFLSGLLNLLFFDRGKTFWYLDPTKSDIWLCCCKWTLNVLGFHIPS